MILEKPNALERASVHEKPKSPERAMTIEKPTVERALARQLSKTLFMTGHQRTHPD
jgi:hypothetical protein